MAERTDTVAGGWRADHDDGVVRLSDGARHLDFHASWLRNLVDPVPGATCIDEVAVDDGVLRMRWRAGDTGRFPIAWLLEHAYAVDRAAVVRPSSQLANIEVPGQGTPLFIMANAFHRLELYGAALIRPEQTRETDYWIEAMVSYGLTVASPVAAWPTAAVELPIGFPVADDEAPHYQLLHVLDARRGELVLADGHAAFAYLESRDLDAARRLISVPVAPGGRPHLRFNEVEGWFRARSHFGRVVRDPRNHYRLRPRPGDVVIVDRHRILLGQTGPIDWQVAAVELDVHERSG